MTPGPDVRLSASRRASNGCQPSVVSRPPRTTTLWPVQPGERFSLIQRIHAVLFQNDWSWPMVDALLDEFSAGWSGEEDPDARVLARLRSLEDDRLVELHAYLLPDEASPAAALPAADDGGPWQDGTLRVFVSHTTAHKVLATHLHAWMARVGIECFVAHDAIEPTREWQDVIESALRTCHVLVAMLTDDFSASRWCDQEVGVAVGRGVLIVPVRMGVDPYGFIGKVQGVTAGQDVMGNWQGETIAAQIFEALASNPLTTGLMADPIVRRFAQSWSWDNSRAAWSFVEKLPREAWTPERLESVREASKMNREITDGVIGDGSGTLFPVVLENHLRTLGIELNPSSEIDFAPRPSGANVADDDIPF